MSDLISRKQATYEMCGDKVFLIIPQNNYNVRRLVMTKDLFRACYEHWIKKVDDNTENSIDKKTGKWLIPQRRGVMSWNEKAYAECSVCHEVIFNARSMKFCPQCGARMVNENE